MSYVNRKRGKWGNASQKHQIRGALAKKSETSFFPPNFSSKKQALPLIKKNKIP